MRVACILPTSESVFRHQRAVDLIQISGLVNLAGYLEHDEHQVRIFDYLAEEGETRHLLDEQLVAFEPEILVMCAAVRMEDVAQFLLTAHVHEPRPTTVCIGTGALDYHLCLQRLSRLDYVVPVEPEPVLGALLEALQKGTPVSQIRGLACRVNDRVHFEKRQTTSLDYIFRWQNVTQTVSALAPTMAYIWGSRGCWYRRCGFCTVGAASQLCHGPGWTNRDVMAVVNDIEALYRQGVRVFHFLDADFIGPGAGGRAHAQALAKEIIRSSMDIRFFIDARVDSLDHDTIRILKQAGLSCVFLGIESCNQPILDRLRKGFTLADIEHGVRCLRRLGVPFRIGWLMADPDASMEEVYNSIEVAKRLRLFVGLDARHIEDLTAINSIFHELHLHAGTPMYEAAVSRRGANGPLESEIACDYRDERITELLTLSRPFRREIARRFRWAKSPGGVGTETRSAGHLKTGSWQKKYAYSLSIVAFCGMETLTKELVAHRAVRGKSEALAAPLKESLKRHDTYWLGDEFDRLRHGPEFGATEEW